MKHLKRYNEDKNIENLEDCLQEVFDKYHISFLDRTNKCDKSFSDLVSSYQQIGMCYYIIRNSKDRQNGFGVDGSVCINRISDIDIYNNIWNDIHKMKSNIEKRLELKIDIVGDANRNKWISIAIPDFYGQGFLKSMSESERFGNGVIKWPEIKKEYDPIMEDLEDYLQEMFDKFLIKKADVSPTNIHGFSNIDKSDNFYRIYKNNKSYFNRNDKAFQVPILSIELNISYHDAVLEYLLKIKPIVEKRLGRKIEIGENMFNRPEDRTQIGVYVPNINESIEGSAIQQPLVENVIKESLMIDDLEDYLQEIFDKYHLPEILSRGNYKAGYEKHTNLIYIMDIKHIFTDLVDDIVTAQPNIEKRLGRPIKIEYMGKHRRDRKMDYRGSNYISIFVEEPSLDQRSKLGLY